MTLDDISGKGDSYDFRGVIRRLGTKEGGNDRREAQVWQADVHAGNGVVHVQSKENTKLMAGRWLSLM